MSPSKLRVGAVRDKGTRPMHAFRTFLGDDDEFSKLPGGVSHDFLFHFLSVCGLDISVIYGAWFRVLVIGLHWRFGSGVGLHVQSLCLRL